MSTIIDQVFVRQYESEVHMAFQRKGSKLRGTVRTKSGIKGSSTDFPKAGTGSATLKSRHGLIPTMNQDFSTVQCSLTDYYAGDWSDQLDEFKTAIDERSVIVNTGAYALGRKCDDLIITALSGASNTTSMTLTSKAAFKNDVLGSIQALYDRDVPDDGDIFGAVSPRYWAHLMNLPEFASADYTGPMLPYINPAFVRTWLGVNWIRHSGLKASTSTNYLYHRIAVGHAVGSDVKSDITWHGDRAAYFIANSMSMGAALIDGNGVQKMTVVEATALPTS